MQVAQQVTTPPFGNVLTNFTHRDVYTHPREITNRFFIATFAAPDALMNIVLPLIAHDKEDVEWTEYYGDIRPLGPHSHQAPHELMYNRSKRMRFSMQWFGLAFQLDASLATTPVHEYMLATNTQLLRSDVHLTIMLQIMDTLLKVPDIYELYSQLLTVKNYHRLTADDAAERVMDLREALPGFLDAQGVATVNGNQDAWIAAFMEQADTILHGHRVQANLVANFMIVSTATARSVRTTRVVESAAPDCSSVSVHEFMRKHTGDSEFMVALRPVSLNQFQGINIIPLEPYQATEGVTNVMEKLDTYGIFHHIRLPTWTPKTNDDWCDGVCVEVPDFAARVNRTLSFRNPHASGICRVNTVAEIFKGFPTSRKDALTAKFTEALAAILAKERDVKKLFSHYRMFYHTYAVRDQAPENDKPFTRVSNSAGFDARYPHISGIAIDSPAAAMQFILDAMFYSEGDAEYDRVYVPTVTITLEGKEYTVPVNPDYTNVLIMRPKIRLATESVVYGIGGRETGATAVGQELYENYNQPNLQREDSRVKMHMGVCLAHPEHIINMPCAKYRQYHSGLGTTLHTTGPLSAFDFNTSMRRRGAIASTTADMIIMAGTCNYTESKSEEHNFGDAASCSVFKHYLHFGHANTFNIGPNTEVYGIAFIKDEETPLLLLGNRILQLATTSFKRKHVDTQGAKQLCWQMTVPSIICDSRLAIAEENKPLRNAQDKTYEMVIKGTASRGPFRAMTAHSALDTLNGRNYRNVLSAA